MNFMTLHNPILVVVAILKYTTPQKKRAQEMITWKSHLVFLFCQFYQNIFGPPKKQAPNDIKGPHSSKGIGHKA